jgi:circadian clock protein KaiC
MAYHTGYHDFKIVSGGLEVYPRLKLDQTDREARWEVMPSGIAKLDTMLGGGLERGSACLIAGQSGTGKTSLVTQYVHTAASEGQASAVFLFDEHIETFYKRAEGLGLALRAQVEAGQLEVRQINSGEVAPGEFMQLIRDAVEKEKTKIVAIDSLGGFLSAMPQERLLVTQLRELLLYLGEQEVLVLLVMTQHGLPGHHSDTPVDLSYLVDTVLLLRHFESEGAIRKAISVLKKRSGFHEKKIREVQVTEEGIQLSEPLIDFSGVLTGFPTYKGPEERLLDEEEEEPDDDGT